MSNDNPFFSLVPDAPAGASTPDSDGNPFLPLVDAEVKQRREKANTVLELVLPRNPDKEAEAKRLSATFGLSVDTVSRNHDELARIARAREIQRMTAASPVLARQLANPDFAALAHDNAENLAGIESAFQFLKNSGNALRSGIYSMNAGIVGVAQAPVDLLAPLLDPLAGRLLPENPLRRVSAGLAEYRQGIDATAKGYMPRGDGNIEQGWYSGLASLSRNLTTLPIAFLPGGQPAALAGMTAPVFGEEFGKARDKGLGPVNAATYGASQAAIEYATEKLPLSRLVGDVKAGEAFFKMLGRQAVAEVPGEQVATILQDLNEWAVLNPEKPFSAYLAERPDAAVQTLVATLVGVGGQTTVVKGIDSAIAMVEGRKQRAEMSEQGAQFLDNLNKLAAADKLLARDPETFEQFVAQAAEAGPVQQVFIDAQTLMQSGVAEQVAAVSPAVASQLATAAQTGGQIAIPVEEYAARIAPTEYAQGLLDHLKTEPEGFSRAEAQQFMQNHAEELQAEVEHILAEKEVDDTFKASAEIVRNEIRSQLDTAARFTPQVNDAYSAMVGNFYATMAAKMGTTPEELFQRYPLKIAAERIDGPQFDQPRYTRDQLLALFNDADTINVEATDVADGVTKDEARFLSNVPAGTRFTHSTRLLGRVRRTSESITHALGTDPAATRTVEGPLGPFSAYEVIGEVQPGDDTYNPGGALKVRIYGKEQVEVGLLDEPALTFTVMPDGELSVNGPTPGGTTFAAFVERGWAEQSKAGDQIAEGWSNLKSPSGSKLPMTQVLDLLSDVHARVRAWRNEDKVGLYWSRATGASAGLGDYGSAVFFQGQQEARGAFNPASLSITLLKNADLSTFLHESGHFFLEVQADLASKLQQEAEIFGMDTLKPGERQILADTDALLKWFGLKDLNEWNGLDFEQKRSYHEQFARGFEAYLFEGKAPSIELQGLFQRFRAWLLSVYRELKALNVELTDEVRGVFDRLLATNEQITLAEQGRSMMPLFTSPEQASMTPEEFAAYQALGVDATAQAIEDLQARGLRDMQWLHNARGRIIKQLQKDAKAQRAAVEMDVRREVMSQPIYRAWQFLTGKLTADDKITPPAKRTSSPDSIDETQDSLFAAIAKLGGLNRAAAQAEWGIDPKERIPMPAFGKHVLRREGGLSIDAMGEALGQYGYLTLDEHGKHDLRQLEDKFFEELRGNTQYSAAYDYAADMETRASEKVVNPQALGAGRFDMGELKAMGLPTEVINAVQARRMTAGNGLHPDIVAELFGFTSGDELVRKLAQVETPSAEIEALTDVRMLEQFGDLASPEAIEKAADKAIHNDARARFVATEANALERATGQRKTLASAARMYAEQIVARLKIRNIKPGQYANAEVRAAKAAEKASKSGDLATAAAEKRNQLIQNYATRAAYDAQENVDRGLRYLKKFEGDIKGLDADYAEQIGNLLERFDLRKGQSNKAVDKRTALAEWIKAQREAGLEPDIPPELENEAFRTSYKNLTVEEFQGLVDTVRQIEHLGRLKHKLLTAADQRAYEAVRDEIAGSIRENAQGRQADTRTPTTNMGRALQGLKRFWASHIKAATWARVMDGGKDGGPMWEYFVRSANERGDQETTMRAEATAKLSEIMAPVFKLGRMSGGGQYFEGVATAADRRQGKTGSSFNRQQRLAIALNTGNAGNLQRLLGGEGWTMAQLTPVLQSLTAQEWAAVQAVWDHFESYRPQIAEKERRIYGKEPEWVAPQPFAVTTADGSTVTLRGGYYPIKYDPAASQRAEEHADAESAKRQLQGAYTTATTRRSFTKARVEEVSGRPLLYTLAGMYSGVNDVIHDLAWHEWLIDANRLLRSHTIDTAIREHYGPEAKQQFKTWVQDVAEGDKGAANAGEAALGRLRQGVSASGLGFNVMSAAIQITGFNQSIVRVGAPWIGRGIAKYLGNPLGLTRTVNEMSDFMANRARTRFRELNELRNQVQDQSAFNEFIGRYAYFMMMRVQQVVDVPTWWGAYEKAIAAGNEEARAVALADQAVIDAQGGGQTKDLSAIERGGPALRLFTVFYSFMNTALNLGVAQTMGANTPAKRAKLAVDYLMLYTVPAVLGYALKAALTPGDSGDDDLEEIAKKLAAEQLSYLMGLMVVVREFGEVAKIATGNPSFGYQGPAGIRAISDAQKFGQQVMQGEFDDAFRKSAVNLIGDLTGLPAAQINRTLTGTQALAEGKTENPAAVAFGFQEPR